MTLRLRSSLLGSFVLVVFAASGCDSGKADPEGQAGDAGEAAGGVENGAGAAGQAGSTNGRGGAGGIEAGGSDASGGSEPAPEGEVGFIIDDFEDGDGVPLIGGGWYVYSDIDNGGGSTITISRDDAGEISMTGEGFESSRSLSIDFDFDQGDLTYEPYVGVGAWLADEDEALDWSNYEGIAYTYRGAAHTVRVETYDVEDYDYYMLAVGASEAWKTVQVPFTTLTQEGWGEAVEFDPSKIGAVSFHLRGATGESGSLELDDLSVMSAGGERTPDMQIRDPAPPADDELDSVEIDNPLQALAMAYLDRGYNITNWLEQSRFESFDYDEDYVANLAAAGFKSLRLPIDLDLYIEERVGAGADTELVLHDDLFLILDSFDAWTEEYGLSLTIDYHQYDHSFDPGSEQSVADMVALWSRVAEHFASNPREDIFFELLNEPELSAGSVAPTEVQWTEIAEQMIAAIREQDSAHTILFGGTEWYGITPLSQREPLSDDNVVYVFHFYEPFIFTHQGATWADLGATHDIPYPYDPARWSEYFSDLGFNASMESWVLGQARSYYQAGNRSALRNRILEAKRWAVEHDVPVICNEFGAYDATSTLEDRARYYTDLIGIFSELEIPWQHWFMIMGSDGTVPPEYVEAMGLED